MIKTSGGPLPTTRYPTAPSLVCAIRTGADTTEAVPGAIGGAEPHALSAKDANAATAIGQDLIEEVSTASRPAFMVCGYLVRSL